MLKSWLRRTKRKWWISRPGKDDYDCTSVKKGSFYSDEYLNILLPQEDSETRDNTYSSQPYNLDEINNEFKKLSFIFFVGYDANNTIEFIF